MEVADGSRWSDDRSRGGGGGRSGGLHRSRQGHRIRAGTRLRGEGRQPVLPRQERAGPAHPGRAAGRGEFADRLGTAIAGRAGKDALVAFADAYRTFALERPGRYAATQIRLDPTVVAGSTAYHRTIEIIYAMLRAYDLTEPDFTDAVRLLRSTFHGYSALEASGGFGAPATCRRPGSSASRRCTSCWSVGRPHSGAGRGERWMSGPRPAPAVRKYPGRSTAR